MADSFKYLSGINERPLEHKAHCRTVSTSNLFNKLKCEEKEQLKDKKIQDRRDAHLRL